MVKGKFMKLLMTVVMAVSFFAFQSNVFAATVGSTILTGPESGWQRYDANHNYVAYTGPWGNSFWASCYNDTLMTATSSDSKMILTFYGTKFRIMDAKNPNRSSSIKLSIDGGAPITFNEYASSAVDQVLVYEKAGLTLGKHTVVASVTDNKVMGFDSFDIDSTGYLIDSRIISPANLSAAAGKSQIDLTWGEVKNAEEYTVKRSSATGGPYSTIASNVTASTYSDINVTPGTTYYYVVTASTTILESLNSNEVSATVEVPNTNRALLTIYLTNGTEKEYDLSMSEIKTFIDWYDRKDAGVGPAKYAFTKTWNKGPFIKRTEYVVFDKILTFNVDEYVSEE